MVVFPPFTIYPVQCSASFSTAILYRHASQKFLTHLTTSLLPAPGRQRSRQDGIQLIAAGVKRLVYQAIVFVLRDETVFIGGFICSQSGL